MKKSLSTDKCAYLFIAPYYIFFLIFVACPVIICIALSFSNYNLKTVSFAGLSNYKKLISDSFFLASLKNTLVYVVFTVFFAIIIGLMLAIALNIAGLKGAKYFRGIIYLPYITAMVAMSMVWIWLFDPTSGAVNALFTSLGFKPQKWLYDEKYAMGCLIIMGIWKNLGYYMTLFFAGLKNIPYYLYEAATIDGANVFQRFRYITLPMLRPITFMVMITGVINAFNVFEQVNVMTSGGPMNSTTTLVHQIYTRAFTEYKVGYASSIAVVLLLIILVFTLMNFKYGNQGQDLDM